MGRLLYVWEDNMKNILCSWFGHKEKAMVIHFDEVEGYETIQVTCQRRFCNYSRTFKQTRDNYFQPNYNLKLTKKEIIGRLNKRGFFKNYTAEECKKLIKMFNIDYVNEVSHPGTNISYANDLQRFLFLLEKLVEII